MPEVTAPQWEKFILQHPEAHLLQTRAWGDLKSAFGWDVARLIVGSEGENSESQSLGAQVLFRRLPFGMTFAYIPKGPVGGDASRSGWAAWDNLWPAVGELCKKHKAIFLKIEPDLWEPEASPQTEVSRIVSAGFQPGLQDIQPRRTLVVDLTISEQEILSRMKQKTRYNIRLSSKKGVVVSPTSDLQGFHRLLQITANRDEFAIHNLEYYRRAFDLFHPRGECELLRAEYEGELLAALMVFAHNRRAWYFYGASSEQHRSRMPTYLLQWEAMRWARNQDCVSYDLWGIPDYGQNALEAEFTQLSGTLWGVYRFKRGFGGELRRTVGSWDRIYKPLMYLFYRLWLKSISNLG